MSFESNRKKVPDRIRQAQRSGDKDALSAMGKKGAEKRNQIRADSEEMERYLKEQALKAAIKEYEQTRKAANEHIVPIDPDEGRETAE